MEQRRGGIGSTSPKGWLRLALRLPILLYRARLGWVLGGRFLLLSHVGRKSGKQYSTVLEVVDNPNAGDSWIVLSGWGEKSQWLKNIAADPQVEVTQGARTKRAIARRLKPDEAERALRNYARRHPRAAKQLAAVILGPHPWNLDAEVALLAALVPLLELRAIE